VARQQDESSVAVEGSPVATSLIDALFRTEAAGLLRYFRRKVGDEAAPDLVQEVFVRLAGSRQTKALSNPPGYVRRIARNLLIDRSRRKTVAEAVFVPLEPHHDMGTAPEQDKILEAAQLLGQYEDAVQSMTEKTRRVYLLHRVEDMSYRDIHRQLGISIATVEYHMMRAIAHIQQVVAPE
jgi:RNA polymerase sigma-70 factor (ECF subfamily)